MTLVDIQMLVDRTEELSNPAISLGRLAKKLGAQKFTYFLEGLYGGKRTGYALKIDGEDFVMFFDPNQGLAFVQTKAEFDQEVAEINNFTN